MRTTYRRVKDFVQKYERPLSSGALITGFIVDSFTLKRIDLLLENIILFSYLLLAGGGILVLNFYMGGKLKARIFERASLFAPFVIQYALGGLFSGFVLFYSRSGALSTSWPFMLLLLAVLFGNEVLRQYYVRLAYQVGIFFFTLFSFSIFYIPILVDSIGRWVFILSGLVSLALILLFLRILYAAVPSHVLQSKNLIAGSILFIYGVINIFYFTNILPPIPLSLKNGSAYHEVVSINGRYEVKREVENKNCLLCFAPTVHIVPGKSIYVYSSVFAPTAIKTSIVHNWQRYTENGEWQSVSKVEFQIIGGRDGGYRGYSQKSNVLPGRWRVNVETPWGQVIGRIRFNVEHVDALPALEQYTEL